MKINRARFEAERDRLLEEHPMHNRKSFCDMHKLNPAYFTKIVSRGKIGANTLKNYVTAGFRLDVIKQTKEEAEQESKG